MLWNFGFVTFPNTFLTFVPFYQKSNFTEGEPKGNEENFSFINLTFEDHLKAGYKKNKKSWTEEEDKLLKNLKEVYNMEWEEISAKIPGRNAKMCYSRYKRMEYNPREHWKESDDQKIKKLVEQLGKDWPQIAVRFQNRSPKQIKDRYMNYLRDQINREVWSLQEDMQLVDLLNKYQRDWKMIESCLVGRTQNQIKNRYFGRIKKLQQKKEAALKVTESDKKQKS